MWDQSSQKQMRRASNILFFDFSFERKYISNLVLYLHFFLGECSFISVSYFERGRCSQQGSIICLIPNDYIWDYTQDFLAVVELFLENI